MSRFVALAAPLALVATGALAACGESKPASPPPSRSASATTASPPPLASVPPGTKLAAEPASAAWKSLLPQGADATLIRYRSTSGIDGSATDVGAVVLTPAGPAPEGGWPIVTVGHGLTGVAGDCGPAENPGLTNIPARLVPLVKSGYLVVMSDYQGLSGPGTHPFLDPKTAAYNLVDAVAAARQLVPQHSNKWAALGHSQGGQAAWAALEHAKEYGKSFQFVGAVALAPAANGPEILDAALAGQLNKGQEALFPALIAGYLAKHPDGKWEDFLSGALLANHEAFTSCAQKNMAKRAEIAAQIAPSDVVPATSQAQDKLRGWLEEISLPKTLGDGPLLVVQGANDELIRPEWVQASVQQGCKLGLRVQEVVRPGQGHADVEDDAAVLDWLGARFAGDQPPPSSCE